MFTNSKTHTELAELLVQAQTGNQNAFAEIYAATVKPQYYLALKTLNDEVLAEDVTQEVFIYLFEHMKDIKYPIALISYMNKTNYHLCLKVLGKEKQGVGLIENLEVRSDMDKNSNETVQNLLESAMFELEPKMKEVVVLKYIQEFKTSEIAAYMNLSQRTVQRMIKNSLGEMKKNLKVSMGRQYGFILPCLPFMGEIIRRSMESGLSVETEVRMFGQIASGLSIPIASIGTVSTLGSVFVERLFASTISKIVVGTTALTGVVITAEYLKPPQFKILEITNTAEYSTGNKYHIQPKSGSSIKQVIVYDEQMKEYLNFLGTGESEIYITKNGKYTIKVVDEHDKSNEKSLEVVNIDIKCPHVEIAFEEDNAILSINDSESGVDFETLTITSDGIEVSHSIDLEKREVRFRNTRNTQVSIQDKLGNETVIRIDKEIRKEIKQ